MKRLAAAAPAKVGAAQRAFCLVTGTAEKGPVVVQTDRRVANLGLYLFPLLSSTCNTASRKQP